MIIYVLVESLYCCMWFQFLCAALLLCENSAKTCKLPAVKGCCHKFLCTNHADLHERKSSAKQIAHPMTDNIKEALDLKNQWALEKVSFNVVSFCYCYFKWFFFSSLIVKICNNRAFVVCELRQRSGKRMYLENASSEWQMCYSLCKRDAMFLRKSLQSLTILTLTGVRRVPSNNVQMMLIYFFLIFTTNRFFVLPTPLPLPITVRSINRKSLMISWYSCTLASLNRKYQWKFLRRLHGCQMSQCESITSRCESRIQ